MRRSPAPLPPLPRRHRSCCRRSTLPGSMWMEFAHIASPTKGSPPDSIYTPIEQTSTNSLKSSQQSPTPQSSARRLPMPEDTNVHMKSPLRDLSVKHPVNKSALP
jgi:hypothetical protein